MLLLSPTRSVATFGPMLYDFVSGSRWDEAVRLCRFVKQASLWGALACMALHANHLDTTETAFAALSLVSVRLVLESCVCVCVILDRVDECAAAGVVQVDKLHYIMYIKDIPSAVARNAELALLKRNPDEVQTVSSRCRCSRRSAALALVSLRWSRRPRSCCCRRRRRWSTARSR